MSDDLSDLYDELAEAGITLVRAEYQGSGDEGYVEEVSSEGADLDHITERAVQEAVYDLLERRYGGWEINEGSEGTVVFDVAKRKATLRHGERVESVTWLPEEII